MAKQVSCGVVFVDTKQQKILMVHPTHQKDFWDFPKGRKEEGETAIEAAIREVEEETSIIVNKEDTLIDYGQHPYNKHKQIHLFVCFDKNINVKELVCETMVEGLKSEFPEVDDFKFFSIEEAKDIMCPSMKKVFVYEIENRLLQHFNYCV